MGEGVLVSERQCGSLQRLFLKPEGIKLATPRVLKRLKCAIVPILCATIDVVSLVFSATGEKMVELVI